MSEAQLAVVVLPPASQRSSVENGTGYVSPCRNSFDTMTEVHGCGGSGWQLVVSNRRIASQAKLAAIIGAPTSHRAISHQGTCMISASGK
jgi:hypothetical protein